METSEKLTGQTLKQWTSLPEGFRVKTFPLLDTGRESPALEVDYGQNTFGLFASFDQSTFSWRTSQACLMQEECSEFSETWPLSGWMQNGKAYQRPTLAPHITVREFSYWGTPTATDGMRSKFSATAKLRSNFGTDTHSIVVQMLRVCGLFPTAEFSGWLMGFPPGWTDLEDTATPSSPKSLNGSDAE